MIRTFDTWDEVKRAYGWTDHDPISQIPKAMFEAMETMKMIINGFQLMPSESGKVRVFDIESDCFVEGAEFDTVDRAQDFVQELSKPGSSARARHLDRVIDRLSGVAR